MAKDKIITGEVVGEMTEELQREFARALARALLAENGREACIKILEGLKNIKS